MNRLQSVQNAADGTGRSNHNAGAPSATLVTGTPERRLQGCDARSSVAVWHFFHQRNLTTTSVFLPMFTSDDYTFHNIVSYDVDNFDDRGFAAAGPGLWNIFPSHAKEETCRTIDSGGR